MEAGHTPGEGQRRANGLRQHLNGLTDGARCKLEMGEGNEVMGDIDMWTVALKVECRRSTSVLSDSVREG
jgi:hypothetical protein